MKTKELIQLIGNNISVAQLSELPEESQLKVIYPAVIKTYVPKHPIGEFLVILGGAQYSKSKNTGSIVQEKDIRVSVYTVVKYLANGKAPEEYIDFLESALSGIRLNNNRAEKMIYPEEIKFIKEENKYWWYETVFVCPLVNLKSGS